MTGVPGAANSTTPSDAGSPSPKDTVVAAPPGRYLRTGIVAAVVLLYVALFTYLGLLRYENFFTANWDLGINQQLLWTTSHGSALYETGDAEFYGVHSFLQVHPTYIALLVAPVYSALPYPTTLFALQAAAFALAIVPLYLIGRRVVENRLTLLLVLGLVLASFPVVSGLLYDFHWEAFLPMEFLWFFYLFRDRRYWLSMVPLLFGLLTLEVFPFLVAGVGLLMLFEALERHGVRRWKTLLRDGDVAWAVGLLVAMAIAYVGLRFVQYVVVPGAIGYAGAPGQLPGAIGGPFAIDATALSLNLSLNYWLLFIASFAFLPLLAPRYLWLTVPWFVYSFFLSPFFSSQFGNQYALVAVATLAVPLVYGAARFETMMRSDSSNSLLPIVFLVTSVALLVAAAIWSPLMLGRNVPWSLRVLIIGAPIAILAGIVLASRAPRASGPRSTSKLRRRSWLRKVPVLATLLTVFIGFNVIMSPLNTQNFRATQYPGYWLQYGTDPAATEMGWLTAKIPRDSVVLASDYLFPYVANNPNAWAVPWFPTLPGQPPQYLPFNATHLPEYVLIDEDDWTNFPCPIAAQLLNRSVYGLVAYVYSTSYLGTISLYELGFSGSPEARYVTVPPPVYYFTASNLTRGASGVIVADPASKFGTVIESAPIPNPPSVTPPLTSNAICAQLNAPLITPPRTAVSSIWYGPYVSLTAGTYVITANISGRLLPGGNASRPIITMNGGTYFVPYLYNFTVTDSEFNATGWTNIVWSLDLPTSYPLMEFRGYLDYYDGHANGAITLNYIQVRA
jgi:uncharacterized membrane protein